jgi:hypothetical protein
MNKVKLQEEMTVVEAVDLVSSLAEIGGPGGERWLDAGQADRNRALIRDSFRTLYRHLRHLYEKDKGQLKDRETGKGIQAVMALVGEAVQKVESQTTLFQGQSVTDFQEYQELQQFYLTTVLQKIREGAGTGEVGSLGTWEGAETPGPGLKDLEMVRADREYELFSIRREDNRPFFSPDLLRHLRLVGDFDETIKDAPFSRMKTIQDRDMQLSAKEILQLVRPHMDEFYKEAMHHKEMELVATLNKGLMALMLSANARNLMQNTPGKSCIRYFADFQGYLRLALDSPQYKKLLSSSESGKFARVLTHLLHALSAFFFMRTSSRKEALEWIHRFVQKGASKTPALPETHSVWDQLQDEDERIRRFLKAYPSGPLLKALHLLQDGSELKGFDPIYQGNFPHQLFNFSDEDLHVTCLRLPCPTAQEQITRSEVVPEFRGLLRYLGSDLKNHKHLLINLQDRTSWNERMRCENIEEFQRDAKALIVVTLPKNTEFYLQSGPYQDMNQANLFIEQFQEQIVSGEECGFYFPSSLKMEELKRFSKKAMSLIHQQIFSGKNTLTHKNRLDFIEIFYHFFTLKIVDLLKPDSISFTCKDAIDEGVVAGVGFYAFLRIMQGERTWTREEKDFLLWMLYTPALTVRERAIDIERLQRLISSMATFQAEMEVQGKAVTHAASKLYSHPFEGMKIQEAS